jgi:periplasmic divalent cation tolerance protein
MSNFCQLWLTCANREEADKIANTLLVKHLVACAKQATIASDFRWQGKIEHSEEVLLVMDSKLEFFDQIEKEVAKLHSYDTFVLQAVSVEKISAGAKSWLEEEFE